MNGTCILDRILGCFWVESVLLVIIFSVVCTLMYPIGFKSQIRVYPTDTVPNKNAIENALFFRKKQQVVL